MSADGGAPIRVPVALGPRSYDVVVGSGLLADAGALLRPLLARPRAVVITDAEVATHHLPSLRQGLDAAGFRLDEVEVPTGEGSKSVGELERVLERLIELEIERDDAVIALGGGVVGDLAGLAASLLRRGVPFVQVPTTLLAQVDSSVGGKTAINSRHGKNLVGAFYQPRLVLADVDVLATLPRRELLAGYAEVVKYGLLGDADFVDWLEANGPRLLAGDTAAQTHAVVTSCRAKAAIVAADERERGDRALLNLGHTFAHALEAEAGYGDRLLHGEAVAIGMVMAFELSSRLGLCPLQDTVRVRRHLAAVGLPTNAREAGLDGFDTVALLAHMRQDKKVRDGRLTFVLAHGIGRAFLTREVDVASVAEMLDRELAA